MGFWDQPLVILKDLLQSCFTWLLAEVINPKFRGHIFIPVERLGQADKVSKNKAQWQFKVVHFDVCITAISSSEKCLFAVRV